MPDPLFRAIDEMPRHAYPFLWADYVELLCLCSRNGSVSSGNLQALRQEAQDVQADDYDDDGHDEVEDGGDVEPAQLDDRVCTRWEDIRRRLQVRATAWQDWPFRLDGAVLTSQFDASNEGHRLYVALLIASSLRLCHRTRSDEVTRAFEEISYHWLRRSLNTLWEVRPFGAHQTLPDAYTGSLRNKLEGLAADICAPLQRSPDAYDPGDSGDGGIDLVAWMRMGDQRGNWPVIFGQCACSPTDWESKQLSVCPSQVEAHLVPQHPGAAYCFVPHDLHESDTTWQRASHVHRTVLIDRARILHLFREVKAWCDLSPWSFVGELFTMQETLAA